MPARDSQRLAVYRWENAIEKRFGLGDRLTLDQCKELVAQVWTDYLPGVKPPRISDGRGRRTACGGPLVIKLPKWSRRIAIVLHETAHSLCPAANGRPWHGPVFAQLVLDLLARYANVPKQEAKSMGVHQKPRRVRFASPAEVPCMPTAAWRNWKRENARLFRAYHEHHSSQPPKYPVSNP